MLSVSETDSKREKKVSVTAGWQAEDALVLRSVSSQRPPRLPSRHGSRLLEQMAYDSHTESVVLLPNRRLLRCFSKGGSQGSNRRRVYKPNSHLSVPQKLKLQKLKRPVASIHPDLAVHLCENRLS
jgi:hypothetical protein